MSLRLSGRALHLLATQANILATWQADAPSVDALRRAAKRGEWVQITKRTYAIGPGDLTAEQRLWAAALHCGPDALLTGQSALAASGWKGEPEGSVDVLVPAAQNPRTPHWIRVHRTTVMPRPAQKRGIPRAESARSTLDAAAWSRTDREAMFVLVTALQQRLVAARTLLRALADRPTLPRRAKIREIVQEYVGGAMSISEMDVSRLCREFGIRQPDRQVPRRSRRGIRRLDVYFDAERVVVEIDGIGHADPENWLDDHERQNDIVIQGDRTFLRVSTWVIKYEPEYFMEQLALALAKG